MLRVKCFFVALLILPILSLPFYARAEMGQEDVIKIDRSLHVDNSTIDNNTRINSIARQFEMDAKVVRHLRASGRGWGEINIELSMANYLHSLEPDTYMSKYDALDKITALRSNGLGWGQIAHNLGFKLGPVISSVKTGHSIEPGSREFNNTSSYKTYKMSKTKTIHTRNERKTTMAFKHRLHHARTAKIRTIHVRHNRPVRAGR